MEKSDIQASARVLSVAMLTNPVHVAVFQGKGEKERIDIEKYKFNRIAPRKLAEVRYLE